MLICVFWCLVTNYMIYEATFMKMQAKMSSLKMFMLAKKLQTPNHGFQDNHEATIGCQDQRKKTKLLDHGICIDIKNIGYII